MRGSKHVGSLSIPKKMADYVERHMDKLVIEQDAYDAVNGYALGIYTKVEIKRYAEYCPICGWHSINNPHQKRLLDENRHKINREFVTIFQWDDCGFNDIGLEQAFDEFEAKGGANNKWES